MVLHILQSEPPHLGHAMQVGKAINVHFHNRGFPCILGISQKDTYNLYNLQVTPALSFLQITKFVI